MKLEVNVEGCIYNSAAADKLPNSPGKEKTRLDLSCFAKNETKKHLDIAQHLFVAVEKGLSDKKLRGGLRGTVLKVKEGEQEKYIVLNTNSLAKRLGVSKRELRKNPDKEKFIEDRLDEIKKNQEKINELIKDPKRKVKDETERGKLLDFVKKQLPDKEVKEKAKKLIVGGFKIRDKTELEEFEKKLWWGKKGGRKELEKISAGKLTKDYGFQAQGKNQSGPVFNPLKDPVKKGGHVIESYDFLYLEKPKKKKGYIAYQVVHPKEERPSYWALLTEKSLTNWLSDEELKEAKEGNDCTKPLNKRLLKEVESRLVSKKTTLKDEELEELKKFFEKLVDSQKIEITISQEQNLWEEG